MTYNVFGGTLSLTQSINLQHPLEGSNWLGLVCGDVTWLWRFRQQVALLDGNTAKILCSLLMSCVNACNSLL